MKTSKVPEKLYGCYKGNGNFFMDCKPFPNDDNIEYIRKDAFIEKAQLFLIDKLKEIPIGNGKMKIKADCSLEEFIEELKDYMKGE